MAEGAAGKEKLRLPDLSIEGFRGIKELTISGLGRVTLFSGKNGVGKTTILDAVRTYAAVARYGTLSDILESREEMVTHVDEDGVEVVRPDWNALFHGRETPSESYISIGPVEETEQLRIEPSAEMSLESQLLEEPVEDQTPVLRVSYRDWGHEIPLVHRSRTRPPRGSRRGDGPYVRCETLGPSLLSNEDMARFWDKVALTDQEDRAIEALNLVYANKIERVAFVANARAHPAPLRQRDRKVVVKMASEDGPVPLKSLGDGATRFFGVALALSSSEDGFLVIDEVENGIHHSVQSDFWKMIMTAAHENNVQVFATTHGWDCVVGFAKAATEMKEADGVLVRLEREGERVYAIEYSEDDLRVAAEQGIEVR